MKTMLVSFGLFTSLFLAESVFAKSVYCYNNSNSDYELELSLSANGKVEAATLSNVDWGAAGEGLAQQVKYNEARSAYEIVSEGSPQVQLSTTAILIIPVSVEQGLGGEVNLVYDVTNPFITEEVFSCSRY